MVDYRSALHALGMDLSDEIDAHLGNVLRRAKLCPEPNTVLYEEIRQGKLPPMEALIRLRPPEALRTTSTPAPTELDSHPLAAKAAEIQDYRTAVPVEESRGFSVVVQITQEAVDDIVGEAFNSGQIRSVWEDNELVPWEEVGLETEVSYRIELKPPKISLDAPFENGVTLILGASASVVLDLNLLDLLSGTSSEYRQQLKIELDVGITIVASIKVDNASTPGKSAVFVNLRDIRDLSITLNDSSLPEPITNFLEALILRIAEREAWDQKEIPLSFDMESAERAGVPIVAVRSKIIPPSAGRPGSLTLALDTTNEGQINDIQYFVPQGQDFAFITTKRFLIDQVWPRQKAGKFPIKDGDLEIHSPHLALGNGYLFAQVEASYEVFDNCLGSWHVDATARVWSGFEPFQHQGIWYVRPYNIRTDIDIDDWDQFIIETILGGLLALIGIGGPFVRAVIVKIVMEALIGHAEDELADEIGGFNFGIRAEIPDTRRLAISSTPVAPAITRGGVTAFGNLSFIDA